MAPSQWFCVLVALCSICPFIALADPDERVQDLMGLAARSKDHVVYLDDGSYPRYGQGKERPYSLVVFFSAKEMNKQNPDLKLDAFREEFGYAAKSFYENNAGTPEAEHLFFAEVEFKHSQNVFRNFKVESLPHVRLVLSGNGTRSETMRFDSSPRTAEGISSFISSKTDLDVGKILRAPLLSPLSMIILGATTVASAPFAIKILLTNQTPLHDPRVWCAFGLAIYFFAVSGGLYNIIRGMPMYMRDRNDPSKTIYWYSGTSAQCGVEGFSVGALHMTVGLLLAFITHGLPLVKSKSVQRMVLLGCLIAGTWAAREVVSLDQWKTGYQIHAFYPRRWR
eukprot:TRINITY_DN26633_c0_g1_i1.p1 TRINITY_DN26633_c0_g1~~TRINITY_DN26633_c0_g1_i1.p1  ORF type:complete len:338 (+),score=9.94 TRINITY_DN26633_c0_g1_i1:74-1087(+)